MIYEFEGKTPEIGEGTFIFENATVIGDVTLGRECYIGPGAVLRGDYGTIVIGDYSAVEDLCMIHARPGEKTSIGSRVTIGHSAVIHNATIRDWAVIGMRAVVSDYADVGEWAVVAEGAVVKNKAVLEPESINVGIPTRPIGRVNEAYKNQWTGFKEIYRQLAAARYPASLKRID